MSRLKKTLSIGLRVAFCALLLLWIFHSIFMSQGKVVAQNSGLDWDHMERFQQWHMAWTTGPSELWRMLRSIRSVPLVVSTLIFGLPLWIGVFRWRIVLEAQGLHLSLNRATTISFVAQFFNSFLLGSTGGDLIKAYYAARETHHKKAEAVTTVFVDRLVGLWSMLLFAGVMMIPNYSMLRASNDIGIPALFILAAFAGLTVVLGIAFWGGVSKGFPKARHYLRRLPKGDVLERSLDSCRQYGKHKSFLLKTVAISLVCNVLAVLQIMLLGQGLDLHIPSIALFIIVPLIFCISALPLTPNGLGVRENLFVMMLAVLKVPKPAALSVSLIASAQGLFWSMVGGLIYMGRREKDHLSEVTHATEGDALKEN
jgi:glycosyltransferase 2 family protein